MQDCNCKSSTTIYEVCHNGCCNENLCELDCIIANLKSELFERQQNIRDYCALESKFIQLQNAVKLLSDQKNCLECELCEVGNEGNKLICNLQMENENLKNELNEKNTLNKKLYGDNNNLFQVLEGKTCDNKNLQDQMCHQENVLQRLSIDKSNLENTINNLNNMKDIQNLNHQISLLNKNSNDLDNSLRDKNCQNIQIVNEFNNEKNINEDLVNVLKNKECALKQIQQELCMANETLSRLEKDFKCLNYSYQKNNGDINCTNNNLKKENSIKKELENNNLKLNCAINDRNSAIEKITNENNILKATNTNINRDNNCLNSKIEAYKKHILILTDQNEKLSAELESILSRDSQLLYTLGRDSHLRALQHENNNNINCSLNCLKASSKYNGCINRINNFSKKNNNDDISGNINNKTGKFGMNLNGSSSLHNSKVGMRNENNEGSGDEQQYSGGEEEQYSGGEGMKYSDGDEDIGQSSGEENQ